MCVCACLSVYVFVCVCLCVALLSLLVHKHSWHWQEQTTTQSQTLLVSLCPVYFFISSNSLTFKSLFLFLSINVFLCCLLNWSAPNYLVEKMFSDAFSPCLYWRFYSSFTLFCDHHFNLKPVSLFSSGSPLPPCLSALTYPRLLLPPFFVPFWNPTILFISLILLPSSHFPPQPIRQITSVPWTAPPGATQRAALPPVGHTWLCTQDLDENNSFTYDTRQETSTSSYICE